MMDTVEPTRHEVHADIVVIGLGVAGACAAIEARDHGASVVVLEKQPREHHRSNTRMSAGGFHSPDPNGDRASLIAYARALFCGLGVAGSWGERRTHYGDELAEAWAEYAPENLSFMQSLDGNFQPDRQPFLGFPDFPGAKGSGYAVARSKYVTDESTVQYGEAFHRCLLSGLSSRGVPIHYATPAHELTLDAGGAVSGVRARHGANTLVYRARRAVVLACGGFEYNARMREAFLGALGADSWAFYGSPANTGDGIGMALRVGAALSNVDSIAGRIIAAVPERRNGLRLGMNTSAVGKPNQIVVDNIGRRYAAECSITRDPSRYHFFKEVIKFDSLSLTYPRIPSWMIFDTALMERGPLVSLAVAAHHGIEWGRDNQIALRNGWILESPTISGLAERIRMHPDNNGRMDGSTLSHSVAVWNQACGVGRDADFGRDATTMGPIETPPFFALPMYPGGPNTKGGLRADGQRRVLGWNDQPIRRLYAAGEIASVFQFAYQGGGNLAEGIVFGRLAGRAAAAEPPRD